ncbi:MAG TPA: GAF domain-containing protein [Thermomicrobiales bacterium]
MTFTIERPVDTVARLRDEAPVALWDDTEAARREVAGTAEGASDLAQGIGAYRALRAFAAEILATSDLERMLERCGQLAQRLLRADACSIALLDEPSGHLVPLLTMASGRTTTIAPLPFDLLDGRMRDAIYAGRSLIVAHGLVIDGDAPLPLPEMQSALAAMLIPLPPEQGQRGIFWVGRIHGEPFTLEEQELAETLSALVALGVRATGLTGR